MILRNRLIEGLSPLERQSIDTQKPLLRVFAPETKKVPEIVTVPKVVEPAPFVPIPVIPPETIASRPISIVVHPEPIIHKPVPVPGIKTEKLEWDPVKKTMEGIINNQEKIVQIPINETLTKMQAKGNVKTINTAKVIANEKSTKILGKIAHHSSSFGIAEKAIAVIPKKKNIIDVFFDVVNDIFKSFG